MKVDLRPVLDQEYWNEDTEQTRVECEDNLKELFAKYNVSEEESQMQGLMDSEITRRRQLLANQALVQSAGDRLRLDKERRAMLAEDRVMTLKIMERDNMTEQDRAVGVKEGAGFKDF